MCLQDLAITLKMRTRTWVQLDGGGPNAIIRGRNDLWSIRFLPAADSAPMVFEINVAGTPTQVGFPNLLNSGGDLVIGRAEFGAVLDRDIRIVNTNSVPVVVICQYLDPDIHAAALELEF